MILALRGLIGTGKTTVANYLKEEYDFVIVNCDDIVANLYEKNEDMKNEIKTALEIDEVNKKNLASVVFENEEKLQLLESIILPFVEKECQNIIENNENVVLDCQTIDKTNIEYDFSIITTCERETIIDRVQERDGRTREEIEKIIKIQNKPYLLTTRSYAIHTEDDYEIDIEKIIRSFNESKNWENR